PGRPCPDDRGPIGPCLGEVLGLDPQEVPAARGHADRHQRPRTRTNLKTTFHPSSPAHTERPRTCSTRAVTTCCSSQWSRVHSSSSLLSPSHVICPRTHSGYSTCSTSCARR